MKFGLKRSEDMDREILLIEDDESLNKAVSFKLKKEGYIVYSAMDIETAKRLWNMHRVPLVICDINLPDGNGLDFCMKIRKESNVVFLFLTALDTEEDMMKGYEAGADDYITKPFFLPVLISKVNVVMQRYAENIQKQGKTGYDENLRKQGGNGYRDIVGAGDDSIVSGSIAFYYEENRVKKNGEYINLTARELQLLSFFMKNPMRILTKNQLLEAIWDIDGDFVDENTLAVNIRRLREKIEDNPSMPGLLKNIRGLGYIWDMECRRSKG